MNRQNTIIRISGQTCAVIAAAILMALTLTMQALAQAGVVLEEYGPRIEQLVRESEMLPDKVEEAKDNDGSLVELRLEAEKLATDVLKTAIVFGPRLSEINARLDQLGPPPAEGQPAEPETVTDNRNTLQSEKARINELIGKAENVSIQVNRQIDRITGLRRDLFTTALSRRTPLSPELASEAWIALGEEFAELRRAVAATVNFAWRFKPLDFTIAALLSLILASIVLIGGRRLFGSMIERDTAVQNPSYLTRLSTAFWSTLLSTAGLSIFLFGTYRMLMNGNLLRPDISAIVYSLLNVIVVVFLVQRLATMILAPSRPSWRLLRIADKPARTIRNLVTAIAFVTGADYFLGAISNALASPVQLTVAKAVGATLLVAPLVAAIAFIRPFERDGEMVQWPKSVRWTLLAIGIVPLLAAFAGYIGFARFILQQIVVTGAILVTMYTGFLSSRALSEEGALAQTAAGAWLGSRDSIDETTLDQMSLVASLLINLLVLVIGVPLILTQWGFRLDEIRSWAYRYASDVTIGSVSFSLIGILTGVVVFIVAYFASRWFQVWLDRKVLKRGRFDSGVRNSIRTAIGYLGIGLALLIGISAAGIDLSNLALVAGALSLGIGFGLQNIVSNFVSGLILLAERPFKAGDWIIAGEHSGTVKKISVRATEIETFQRQTIILPNSDLINSAVGNWTHRNHLGRVEIAIGVSYDSDVHRVRELLLEIGSAHPLVLRNPEPQVFFTDFGASSLDFELRVFLADVFNTMIVQTDLRLEIMDRFRAENIEIPFPQQDVHVKLPANAHPLAAVEAEKAAAPNKPRRRRKQDPE